MTLVIRADRNLCGGIQGNEEAALKGPQFLKHMCACLYTHTYTHIIRVCIHTHTCIRYQQESLHSLDSELPHPHSAQAWLGLLKISCAPAVQQKTVSNIVREQIPFNCTISEKFYTLDGLETLYLWGVAPKRNVSPNSWGQAYVSNVYLTHR